MTWPLLLDYNRDECKRILRKLELEAYASLVTAFRAQGDLTKEKKKMLQELCSILSISLERHRAEIRRAVNDEKLNTIADRMIGPNTGLEWAIEGRRLVPLMPRLVPQTAFTVLANNLANIQAAKNASMPVPSLTGSKIDSSLNEDASPVKKRKRSNSIESPTSPSKVPFSPPPLLLAPASAGPSGPGTLLGGPITGPNHQQVAQLLAPLMPSSQQSSLVSPNLLQTSSLMTTVAPAPLMSPSLQLGSPLGSPIIPQSHQSLSGSSASIHLTNLSSVVRSATSTSSTPTTFAQGSAMTATIAPSTSMSERGGMGRGTRGGHRMIAPAGTMQHHSTKQVILVSGSGGTIPPSILQRCLSVPMVKAMSGSPVGSGSIPATLIGKSTTVTSPVNISASGLSTTNSMGGNMVVYTTTTRARGSRNAGPRHQGPRPRSGITGQIQLQPPTPGGTLMGLNPALQFPTLIGGPGKTTMTSMRGQSPTGLAKGTRMMKGDSAAAVLKMASQVAASGGVGMGVGLSSTRILPKPSLYSPKLSPQQTNLTLGPMTTSVGPMTTSVGPIMVVGGGQTQTIKAAKQQNTLGGSPRIVNVMSVTPAPIRQPPTNTYSSKGNRLTAASKAAAAALASSSSSSPPSSISSTSMGGTLMTTQATSSQSASAMMTVSSSGSAIVGGIKPNVIVVHKAHAWPQTQQPPQPQTHQLPLSHQKVQLVKKGGIIGEHKTVTAALKSKNFAPGAAMGGDTLQMSSSKGLTLRRVSASSVTLPSGMSITELDPSQFDPRNNLLADIISATGINHDATNSALTAGTIKKIQTAGITSSPSSLTPITSGNLVKTSPSLAHLNVSKISIPKGKMTEIVGKQTRASTLSAAAASKSMTVASKISLAKQRKLQQIKTQVETITIEDTVPEHDKIEMVPSSNTSVTTTATTTTTGEAESDTTFSMDAVEDVTSMSNYQEIQLPLVNQLEEGQVLEIQAPDAANLLNASGQLSKEVLDLLQQVGIQLNQDTVTLDTSGLTLTTNSEAVQDDGDNGNDDGDHLRDTTETTILNEDDLKGEVQLDPTTGMLFLQPASSTSSATMCAQEQDGKEESGQVVETESGLFKVFCSGDLTSNSFVSSNDIIQIITEESATSAQEEENMATEETCSVNSNTKNNLMVEEEQREEDCLMESEVASSVELNFPFQNLVVGECVTVLAAEDIEAQSERMENEPQSQEDLVPEELVVELGGVEIGSEMETVITEEGVDVTSGGNVVIEEAGCCDILMDTAEEEP